MIDYKKYLNKEQYEVVKTTEDRYLSRREPGRKDLYLGTPCYI